MAEAPVPASSSTWSREDQGRMGGTGKGASHRCNLHCPSQTGRCYSCSCRAAAPLCPPRHREGRGRRWHPFPRLRAPPCTQSRGTRPLAGREGRPSTASPCSQRWPCCSPLFSTAFPSCIQLASRADLAPSLGCLRTTKGQPSCESLSQTVQRFLLLANPQNSTGNVYKNSDSWALPQTSQILVLELDP